MSGSIELAIIIPAYKSNFLALALQSLASQTDKRFNLYIGDDCSPEDLETICQPFQNRLSITFQKFAQNLGSTSLVQQWHRCIAMSKDEPWIWIFSDDDIIEPLCVERFYASIDINKSKYDVYRYNIDWIDGSGKIIYKNPFHPEVESAYDFAIQKLNFERHSTACEYIFSRSVFEREGGIIEFPLAWFSDDASWISFSRNTGIYTIAGPKVFWRYSGHNISSNNSLHKEKKTEATLAYLAWLNDWLLEMKIKNAASDKSLKKLQKSWFGKQLQVFDAYLSFNECKYLAEKTAIIWNENFSTSIFWCFKFNILEFYKKNIFLKILRTFKRKSKNIVKKLIRK